MREILFKGKRTDNSEWVCGWYAPLVCNDKTVIPYIRNENGTDKEVVPETVGQYTGLTDKNGKKIFEGDILHREIYWGWYVGYDNGAFRRIPLNDVQRVNWKLHTLHQEGLETWEVIGNIHDNPELVEVGK